MRVISPLSTITAAIALAMALGACSAAPLSGGSGAAASSTATAAVHPVSGLPVIDLVVQSGGKPHAFRVEVARSNQEQAKGLMFRTVAAAVLELNGGRAAQLGLKPGDLVSWTLPS